MSGCVTVNVNEAKVLLPMERLDNAAKSGQTMRFSHQIKARKIQSEHFTIPSSLGPIAASRMTRPENIDKPLVVSCVGTSADRYRGGFYYTRKAIDNADVLIFDYPGYNDSPGTATAKNFVKAGAAVAEFLKSEKQRTGRKLIAFGHSLGGFVCADLVERSGVFDGMIIETSAQNIEQVVKARTPPVIGIFLKPKIDNSLRAFDIAKSLNDFEGPILVLGAKKDKVLKVKLSRQLFSNLQAQGNDVTYEEFEDSGHEDVYKANKFPSVMRRFFRRFNPSIHSIPIASSRQTYLKNFRLKPRSVMPSARQSSINRSRN